MAKRNLMGQQFGRWLVVGEAESAGGGARWRCRCQCGGEGEVAAKHLLSGASKSCGCLCSEASATRAAGRAVPFEDRLTRNDATGCLEWQGSRDRDGYGTLRAGRRDHKAHRVAYERAHGPVPAGRVVCHTCDNPPCCEPSHLFLGTVAENNADRQSKGRQARGVRSAWAKLTDHMVRQVRALVASGASQQAVADLFGIHQTTVSAIHRRRAWAHVD